jgi:hypothetical protein
MILKGSQRGSAMELGLHLMKAENEHVELHELRGFVSESVLGAMKEIQAVSRGTRCRQPLFSVSFNPPETEAVSIAAFERAIEEVETANGLSGQPRIVVFHEKEGRRHAHCVWSRIDADTMTARPLPFFKNKLREVSKGLYLEHGWRMPMGLIDSSQRDPLNFNLAEWQQAKREGNDPRALKSLLQECWAASDNASAFEQSLKERGIHLAAGDRRSFVVVDFQGEVHSLPRALGLKTKDVAARLGNASLKPVETVRADVSARMTGAIKRHISDARTAFQERSKTLGQAKRNMGASHRADRTTLKDRQRDQWDKATRERASRLPRGVKALWWRLTGQYKEVRARNEGEAKEQRETQRTERERLVVRQLEERRVLKTQEQSLRTEQADRLKELRGDVGRFLGLSRGRDAPRSQQRGHGLGLKLER